MSDINSQSGSENDGGNIGAQGSAKPDGASVSGGSRGIAGKSAGKPIIIDPGTIGGNAGSGDGNPTGSNIGDAPRRKRGRPAGSSNGPKRDKASSLDLDGLSAILVSSHGILAAFFKVEELNLDEKEAKALATALLNVERHYNLPVTQKALDWAALIQAGAMIYGARVMAFKLRIKTEKAEAETPEPQPSLFNPLNGGARVTQ